MLPPAEQYLEVGYNYRMTDLQAAVGLVQLDRLRRRRRAPSGDRRRLPRPSPTSPGLRCVADPVWGAANFQSCWVEVDAGLRVDREGCLAHSPPRDISARRGIMAAHRQPAYEAAHPADPLPVTEHLTDNTLILPLFHQMTDAEQDQVMAAVAERRALPG